MWLITLETMVVYALVLMRWENENTKMVKSEGENGIWSSGLISTGRDHCVPPEVLNWRIKDGLWCWHQPTMSRLAGLDAVRLQLERDDRVPVSCVCQCWTNRKSGSRNLPRHRRMACSQNDYWDDLHKHRTRMSWRWSPETVKECSPLMLWVRVNEEPHPSTGQRANLVRVLRFSLAFLLKGELLTSLITPWPVIISRRLKYCRACAWRAGQWMWPSDFCVDGRIALGIWGGRDVDRTDGGPSCWASKG